MTDPASAVERIETASTGADKREAADEAVNATTSNHQTAEGTDAPPSLGSRQGLKDALLRTSPSRRLEDVESPWDPERGGINRVYRGLQKALDFEGTPAVVDVVVGIAEFVVRFEPDGAEPDDQEDEDVDDFEQIVGGGGEAV